VVRHDVTIASPLNLPATIAGTRMSCTAQRRGAAAGVMIDDGRLGPRLFRTRCWRSPASPHDEGGHGTDGRISSPTSRFWFWPVSSFSVISKVPQHVHTPLRFRHERDHALCLGGSSWLVSAVAHLLRCGAKICLCWHRLGTINDHRRILVTDRMRGCSRAARPKQRAPGPEKERT